MEPTHVQRGNLSLPASPGTQRELLDVLIKHALPEDGFRVTESPEADLYFPEKQRAAVERALHGDAIRKEGITVYSLSDSLSPEALNHIVEGMEFSNIAREMLNFDTAISRINRVLAGEGLQSEKTYLYHVTSALSYAFNQSFGWLDAEDMSWYCADHLQLENFQEGDTFGCFYGINPLALRGYAVPGGGFFGLGSKIFEGMGVDLSDPDIKRLLSQNVVLEIDPEIFRTQLGPKGTEKNAFAIRDHEINLAAGIELIAPVFASPFLDGGQGVRVVALLE